MKYYHSLAATSIITLSLLSAAPAFAEDHGDRNVNLNVGGTVHALMHHDRDTDRGDRTASSTVSIRGHLTAINGSTLTVQGMKGAVYTVNAMNADITSEGNLALTAGNLSVGDTVKVVGTLSGSTITAEKIRDHSVSKREKKLSGTVTAISGTMLTLSSAHGETITVNAASSTVNGTMDNFAKIQVGDRVEIKGAMSGTTLNALRIVDNAIKERAEISVYDGVRAGIVTAVNGSVITIQRVGAGLSTVNTTASTFFSLNGAAATASAVKVGSKILAFGPTVSASSTDSITASTVLVFDRSLSFFRNLFR